ncbi:MAG: tRNA-(ms[2]io[6]A)-hydroxylase [Leptolyngbya sp. RL_3_1]|nr:tRNA-(ms[2]io[6]A)-hydroxylase [Leptolyngbya sp. RL_3_1]
MAPTIANPFPTIHLLKTPTRDSWVGEALADLDIILLDHSHCERKAAGVAMNLMFRYPSSEKLVYVLTDIAQEELSHFAQVNHWLAQRRVPLRQLPAPPYGAGLSRQVRKGEPERMLDSLLVAALIEARSHERLGLLASHCPEAKLAAFYRSLMASEARHYGAYWVLATTYFDRDLVATRLEDLARVESELLAMPYPAPRIHS